MKIITCLLIGFFIHSCLCEPRKCKNCSQRKTDLPMEQLRQLRYEYLKNQILKKLHLTEAPKTNLPKPPVKTLLVIAEMEENETILENDDQPKTESVVIYPKDENLSCSENESHSCNRFEFTLPESLLLDHFLAAEVWFYINHTKFVRVYQVITDHLQNLTSSFQLDNMMMEKNIRSWAKCSVPSFRFRLNFTTENILAIEVIEEERETDSESVVDENTEDEKPFLVIRSEVIEKSTRRKRSTTCVESSTSCCKENFFLNFSEIGWDNWILHPDGYQANFCRGRCFNDLSNTRFYHSAVLLSYIRDNRDIAEEIGLNMCCTPSVMAPVTIIYRNEEDLIYHKSIENMKVEACDCA